MVAPVTMDALKNHLVVVTKHGGPEVLQMIEDHIPEPQTDEVRVKVLAAGISAYDLMHRSSGKLPGTPKPPFTLGEDIVGIVDKVGENVTSLETGQMVAGATFCLGLGGGYAEYICLPESELVPVPAGVDPAQAVCVVVNYLTAHMAMHRTANVQQAANAFLFKVQRAGSVLPCLNWANLLVWKCRHGFQLQS